MNIPEIKRCPKCGITKSSSEFTKCKSRYDGLHGHCKDCKSAYSRERWASTGFQAHEKRRRRKVLHDPVNLAEMRRYKREWVSRKRHSDPEYRKHESDKTAEYIRQRWHNDLEWRDRVRERNRKY